MQLTPISYSVFNDIMSQILILETYIIMLTAIDAYYLVYPAL